jgi:hypothetical protein
VGARALLAHSRTFFALTSAKNTHTPVKMVDASICGFLQEPKPLVQEGFVNFGLGRLTLQTLVFS